MNSKDLALALAMLSAVRGYHLTIVSSTSLMDRGFKPGGTTRHCNEAGWGQGEQATRKVVFQNYTVCLKTSRIRSGPSNTTI